MLVDFPATGRAGRTRELVLGDIPYIIPYRVGHDVEILTIMHAQQRWPSVL